MKLETIPRASYTDEAQVELTVLMKSLEGCDLQQLTAIGIAAILDKLSRPHYPLTLKEEAIRLTLNKARSK
jgi:hypothetical protein